MVTTITINENIRMPRHLTIARTVAKSLADTARGYGMTVIDPHPDTQSDYRTTVTLVGVNVWDRRHMLAIAASMVGGTGVTVRFVTR